MNAHHPFLLAMQASHDDDTPRLVYADFLEEQGESERAELIRVQCELKRLPDDEDDRRFALSIRESELLAAHSGHWRAALPQASSITWGEFRCGFIEDIRAVNGDAFLAVAQRMHAATILRGLGVLTWGATELVSSPQLAGLHRLQIQHGLPNTGLRALADSPHLGELRSLDLHGNVFDQPSWQYLIASPRLPKLDSLHVGYQQDWGRETAITLAASPLSGQLRELSIAGCHLQNDGLQYLTGKAFRHLRRLDLNNNQLTNGAGVLLAEASFVDSLQELTLNHNEICSAGMGMFCSGTWANLRSLSIARNPLRDAGVRLLSESSVARGLHRLMLGKIGLTDAGIIHLAGHPAFAKLQTLSLSHNRISDEGLRTLAESPYLSRLETLSLHGCPITQRGIAALTKSRRLPHLDSIHTDLL